MAGIPGPLSLPDLSADYGQLEQFPERWNRSVCCLPCTQATRCVEQLHKVAVLVVAVAVLVVVDVFVPLVPLVPLVLQYGYTFIGLSMCII